MEKEYSSCLIGTPTRRPDSLPKGRHLGAGPCAQPPAFFSREVGSASWARSHPVATRRRRRCEPGWAPPLSDQQRARGGHDCLKRARFCSQPRGRQRSWSRRKLRVGGLGARQLGKAWSAALVWEQMWTALQPLRTASNRKSLARTARLHGFQPMLALSASWCSGKEDGSRAQGPQAGLRFF